MSVPQALLLAALQGISELFPVSSLGHTVVLPALLGWDLDQRSPTFLPFLVMLHLGTATALLTFFWRDWRIIVGALVRSAVRGRLSGDPAERDAWLIVVGTVPAAIAGLFFERELKALFATPAIAAVFLVVNGVVLLLGERARRGGAARTRVAAEVTADEGELGLTALSWRTAFAIGVVQSAALIPGISRSGTTMVAGLVAGLDHRAAARFSFLLATPIILGAGLLEVPTLLGPEGRSELAVATVGALVAGITAWLSVRYLMRYFRVGRLDPFAYYCLAFGALSLAILGVKG